MSDHATWDRLVTAHGRTDHESSGALPIHEPNAAVLACADARVPPSVIFDQPAGSLFVVRIAGNTASDAALASLDYAIGVLGVDLLVVLGHTGCGAVAAAVDGTCGGHLKAVVEPICELVRSMPDASVDKIVSLNVARTVELLTEHGGPVGDAVRAGRLEVRGAVHDLSTGQLVPVTTVHRSPVPNTMEAP